MELITTFKWLLRLGRGYLSVVIREVVDIVQLIT